MVHSRVRVRVEACPRLVRSGADWRQVVSSLDIRLKLTVRAGLCWARIRCDMHADAEQEHICLCTMLPIADGCSIEL